MRKVVQVWQSSEDILTCFCDDGTFWYFHSRTNEWTYWDIPPIPQFNPVTSADFEEVNK